MSKLENGVERRCPVLEKLYSVAMDCLAERDPAMINAGAVNAAAVRLAKMQGWDPLDEHEISKPNEFESMTSLRSAAPRLSS